MAGPSKPKRSIWKIGMWGAVLVAVLMVSALLIVPRLIPWDKVKSQAEEKISAIIHHKVSIGSIGFNLFKGIEVRDLTIANAQGFSEQPLLTDKAVMVRYRLLPILVGRIVIKSVELQNPSLLVEKAPDGTMNFSDMLSTKKEHAASEPEVKETAGMALNLLVAKFAVTDAVLVYRDRAAKAEYGIEKLNLSVDNLTLAGLTPVAVKLSAEVKALEKVYPISLAGQFRIEYTQETLRLDDLVVNLPGVKLTAAGSIENMLSDPLLKMSGKADLDAAMMLAELPPPALKKKIPGDFHAKGLSNITFNLAGSAKRIDRLSVTAEESIVLELQTKGLTIPLGIQGKVGFEKGNVRVDQTLTFPGFDAALKADMGDVLHARDLNAKLQCTMKLAEMVPTMIPSQLSQALDGLETGGTVQVSADVKGPVTQLKSLALHGVIEMKNGQVSYQGKDLLEGLAWLVDIKPEKVELKRLDAQLGGQAFSGRFTADRFDLRDPATLKPDTLKSRLVWEVKSKMLDVDALMALLPGKDKKAAAAGDAEETEQPKPVKPEPDVRPWVPLGLEISGNAELGGLKYGTVKLGKIDFRFEQKKRVLNMSGTIRGYQGQIQNTTRLDYSQKTLGYAVKADVSKVDLEPLLNDITDTFVAAKLNKPKIISELKDKITGQMDGTLSLEGQGIRTQTAMPNLKGKGNFTIKAGRLRKFAFQDELAKLFGSDKFRQDIPFDHTLVEFTIGGQKVMVKKFIMESGLRGQSGDIRMTAEGAILFGAAFENFKLRPRLNPRAASNLSEQFRQYSEILKDDQGWVTIPVVLDGPMKKPAVKPDWDWIKKQMSDYAKGKVKKVTQKAEKKVKQFVDQQQGKSTKEIQENMSREIEKAKEKMKNLDLKNMFK